MLLRLLSVAGLFFSLDQFTKMLVARRLAEGQSVACASWIRIRRVTNARGLLLHNPRVMLGVLAGLLCGICLIVWQGYFFNTGSPSSHSAWRWAVPAATPTINSDTTP